MQLKVLYHGNCFDGCASAALFSRFFVEREGGRLDAVRFAPLHHQQGDPFPKDAFDADVNACVDFRFSASPALHWWFDHHASAFPTPADRAAFERDATGNKFWDPAAPSCTGFVARTLSERHGWRADDLADLVRWADIIDAARFPSPGGGGPARGAGAADHDAPRGDEGPPGADPRHRGDAAPPPRGDRGGAVGRGTSRPSSSSGTAPRWTSCAGSRGSRAAS